MVGDTNNRHSLNTAWAQDNNFITANPKNYFWKSSCCNSPIPSPGCSCVKKCRHTKIKRENTQNLISRSVQDIPTADFSKSRIVPETHNRRTF